jgi:hypothetical protein
MTVKRKFIEALEVKSLETKEATEMLERFEVPREVIKQIKHLEAELDPPKPFVFVSKDFGIARHSDPKDLRIQKWAREFGAATRLSTEPALKTTVNRLKLLAITNPGAALREAQYLSGATNPLLDWLPKKPERSSDRATYDRTKLLQDTMGRIENFHYTNELRRKRGVEAIPVLKARLVEQNEFHKQAIEEGDPWGTAGIFEFRCPNCGQDHLIGVSVPEWHSRKTLPKTIHCTPYGSAYSFAFELEGIED